MENNIKYNIYYRPKYYEVSVIKETELGRDDKNVEMLFNVVHTERILNNSQLVKLYNNG